MFKEVIMKKLLLSTAVSSLFFFTLGGLQIAKAGLLYPVEVSSQTPMVKISKIKIQQHNQIWVLSGVVKRHSYNSSALPGHIDVAIMGPNDGKKPQIITESVIDYSPSLSLRRWRSGSRFDITLPNNLPIGSTIKLKWHKNHVLSQLNKGHSAWL